MILRRFFHSVRVPTRIEILSKPNCCLCDQAFFQISRLVDNIKSENPAKNFILEKVNIESDPDLNDEYSLTIPVIRVDGAVVSESVVNVPKLRKILQ